MDNIQRANWDDLDIDPSDARILLGDALYTGIAEARYPCGNLESEKLIYQGCDVNISRAWYLSGGKQHVERYPDPTMHERIAWHENGVMSFRLLRLLRLEILRQEFDEQGVLQNEYRIPDSSPTLKKTQDKIALGATIIQPYLTTLWDPLASNP